MANPFGDMGKSLESMFKWFFIFAAISVASVIGGGAYGIYLLFKHFGVV